MTTAWQTAICTWMKIRRTVRRRSCTTGECERIDGKLGDRLIRPRIGLVVEDVHGSVSDLKEIDVAVDDEEFNSAQATATSQILRRPRTVRSFIVLWMCLIL